MECRLCPRECGADRITSFGVCGGGVKSRVARAFAYMWEEPVISGARGSGAVFFCGCHLRCVFCQNHEIMSADEGEEYEADELCGLFLRLQESGVHNINLVTASHYVDLVAAALKSAKENGLNIPVIYNCGGYESIESIELLSALVDVWLPDLKYIDSDLAGLVCGAPDYPERAIAAIKAMRRLCPVNTYEESGGCRLIKKGVIIRHLVLPECGGNTRKTLSVLAGEFHDVPISLMSQYYPVKVFDGKLRFLNRTLVESEYNRARDYMEALGLKGYIQELESASAAYVPKFK